MTLDPVLAKLYSTTDAMVWAEEWCKIAKGVSDESPSFEEALIDIIDPGWMVGWFANAMAVAEMKAKAETRPVYSQEARERRRGARTSAWAMARDMVKPIIEKYGLEQYSTGNVLTTSYTNTQVDQHLGHIQAVADWLMEGEE